MLNNALASLDLNSLPTSVRRKMETAQSLANDDRPAEARSMFQEAAVELARQKPELLILLMALNSGAHTLALDEEHVHEVVTRTDHCFLGIRYAWDTETVTTFDRLNRTLSLY